MIRDRSFWTVVALIAAVLLILQMSGGAYQAEFTGHADEAAHFVSGLMLHDYMTTLPRQDPIGWATQYYLHYPKVAIGHWPPEYHILEALWWVPWGPSRITSMLLQWLIGLVTLAILYHLIRQFLSTPISLAIVTLTIASPIFQESLEQTMVDLCSLLWAVLVMHASVRLLERQDSAAWLLLVLWLLGAAFTKGTAVCLAPVPIIALIASRRPIRLPAVPVIVASSVLAASGAWYVSMGGIAAWGGMSASAPWPGYLIGRMAGWGFLVLGVYGLRRQPLALVAASLIVSTVGVSLVVRAMREDRHWIIALPPILILAGFAIDRIQRPVVAAVVLIPALALFPYARYRQSQSGFGDLLRQLHTPARMLVSSAGIGEGSWIAVTSLSEKRPSSFIVRGSKILALEGWSGEGYRLLTPDPDSISRRIDELALDIVVLHTPPGDHPPPHHTLLQQTVAHNPAWKPCATAQDLRAYCRVLPPRVPRQPLRLQIRGREFVETISLHP